MSNLEIIDDKTATLTFNIEPQDFINAIDVVYKRNRNKVNIPGFRKGKVPLKIIQNYYGEDFYYNDAINHVLPETFDKAMSEHDTETVGYPEFDLSGIDEDKRVTLTAKLTLRPVATVSNYKGITFKQSPVNVSDDEINKQIDIEREKNARVLNVDRPIENNDIVTIDFEGFVDGIPFDGGKAEDYDLTIGSHSFIDTFEEQLIGKNINDELDVNVTFPEQYGKEELNGKPALFKVKIKKICVKELPELNDEFAQDVSEFDSLNEYKKDIMAKLTSDKENKAKQEKENNVLDNLIKNVTVDIPKVMIDASAEDMLRRFEHNLSAQKLSLDVYLQYMGQTRESMLDMYRVSSERQIKIRLALEFIARNENFKVTQEEIDAEIDKVVAETKLEKEKITSLMTEKELSGMKKDIAVQKALQFVLDNAVAEEA